MKKQKQRKEIVNTPPNPFTEAIAYLEKMAATERKHERDRRWHGGWCDANAENHGKTAAAFELAIDSMKQHQAKVEREFFIDQTSSGADRMLKRMFKNHEPKKLV